MRGKAPTEWIGGSKKRTGGIEVDGSLVNMMILEQLAGQYRWRGEWVLLEFRSWGHLLLIQPGFQKVFLNENRAVEGRS